MVDFALCAPGAKFVNRQWFWFTKTASMHKGLLARSRETAVRRIGQIVRLFRRPQRSEASDIKMENVRFPSTNQAGDGVGVLFGDPTQSKQGLLVVHEWWGLNDQIQITGEKIAKEGNFVVLVPDLYRGKVAKDYETAGHLMSTLDWPGALLDISAAASFLKSRGCNKVGITGFCMGGALSLAAAVKCPEIDAAVPFYGVPPSDLADLTQARVPVQGHFGEKDETAGFADRATYEPVSVKLTKSGVTLDFNTYDAGHAFVNKENPNYDEEIATLALQRTYEFLHKHLS